MPSIQGYLNDVTKPTIYFLEAAADLCGVDRPWLSHGVGHPTEDHVKAHIATATVSAQMVIGNVFTLTGSEPDLAMLHGTVFTKLGRLLSDTPPPWLAGLIEVWLQLSEPRFLSDSDADFEATVTDTLMRPLELMGVDPVKMHEGRNFDPYVFAMTPVMLLLAEERARQRKTLEAEEED